MDDGKPKGFVGETRELLEKYMPPEIRTVHDPVTGTPALIELSGKGARVISADSFDSYREAPARRRGTAVLLTLDSFIDHANRFKDAHSAVFANDDRKSPSLTSVLNYHEDGKESEAAPRFGDHRGTFAFPLSDEWKAWNDANKQVMKMTEFAEFLEERIIDVLQIIPEEDELGEDLQRYINAGGGNGMIASPARLMELSRSLHVNESSVVRQVNRLESGEGQVMFSTEHSDAAGQPIKIPSLFIIGIPVFRKGPIYRIAARLRYRLAGGVVFWFELWRLDRTFDHAFGEAAERVRVETDLPLLFGKPE